MEQSPPSVDFGYLLERTISLVYGGATQAGEGISANFLFSTQQLALLGMAISVVMLALLVYFKTRLVMVEHEGLHAKEEEERAQMQAPEQSTKDPRWERVVALTSSGEESDWRRAIMEADVMLGELLSDKGYMGESIGEQLKLANPLQFTTLDIAWQAHKMRNALAHLGEAFPLSVRDARATVDQYARVFEEFGII